VGYPATKESCCGHPTHIAGGVIEDRMKRFYPYCVLAMVVVCGSFGQAQNAKSAQNNGSQAQSQSQSSQPASPAAPAVASPADLPAPVTQRYDNADQGPVGTGEPILPAPPMPKSTTTLVGGTVDGVDHVRDRVALRPFGGKKMVVHFDERTHIYKDGVETTQLAIHKGDRVYVDTMSDGSQVLARNIRVITQVNAADARGQVLVNSGNEISLRDDLSGEPVSLAIDRDTHVVRDGKQATVADLTPGSLVTVQFAPDKADRGIAREIRVLAAPGAVFTFAGRVTNLDLSVGQLSIANQSDNKTYDISVVRPLLPGDLMVGSDVVVKAMFDGKEYRANSVNVTQARTGK
jgi:hypothetical protein